MPNQNWIKGIRCPKCGNDEGPFVIDVRCRLHTYDDQFKNEEGCWIDDDAYCQCPQCNLASIVNDFRDSKSLEQDIQSYFFGPKLAPEKSDFAEMEIVFRWVKRNEAGLMIVPVGRLAGGRETVEWMRSLWLDNKAGA